MKETKKFLCLLLTMSTIMSSCLEVSAKSLLDSGQEENSSMLTETIIEYNLEDKSTNEINLKVDKTLTDTSMFINGTTPLSIEPIDTPEYWPFNAVIVLTAAHCVRSKEYGEAVKMTFFAGYQSNGNYLAKSTATAYYIPGFWTDSEHPEYDWALLKLRKSMPASKTGILTCKVKSTKGKKVMVLGYGSENNTYNDEHISEGKVTSDDVLGIAVRSLALGHAAGPKINTTMINLIKNINDSK